MGNLLHEGETISSIVVDTTEISTYPLRDIITETKSKTDEILLTEAKYFDIKLQFRNGVEKSLYKDFSLSEAEKEIIRKEILEGRQAYYYPFMVGGLSPNGKFKGIPDIILQNDFGNTKLEIPKPTYKNFLTYLLFRVFAKKNIFDEITCGSFVELMLGDDYKANEYFGVNSKKHSLRTCQLGYDLQKIELNNEELVGFLKNSKIGEVFLIGESVMQYRGQEAYIVAGFDEPLYGFHYIYSLGNDLFLSKFGTHEVYVNDINTIGNIYTFDTCYQVFRS